jgi:hypothetical protein
MPTSAPSASWDAIASSADGTKLAAAVGFLGTIYLSTNAGSTWKATSAPTLAWQTIVSSADGNKLVAGASDNRLYLLQTNSRPKLDIIYAESQAVISWVVPSRNFVLQELPDATTTNWTTVMAPVVMSNLQYHVVVSTLAGSGFYRLKLQ